MTKKETCIRNKLQHQCHFLSSIPRKPTSFSYQCSFSTTKLSGSQHHCFPGQAHLYGLCGLWKLPGQIQLMFLVKNDSNCLSVKRKTFKKDYRRDFSFVRSLTMGEADFHQFMGLRNQSVNAAENFGREKSLSPVLIPTMSRDRDEQLKLIHNNVDIVARHYSKIRVNLPLYHVNMPLSSYSQVRFFAKKKEDKNFHKVVYLKYNLTIFLSTWSNEVCYF